MDLGFTDPWLPEGAAPPPQTFAQAPEAEGRPGVPPPGSFESPEAERQALWAAVYDIGRQVSSSQASQDRMAASLDALTAFLRSQPAQPAAPPPPAPAPAPTTSQPNPNDPRGVPRFKEPAVFDGSASNVESWIDDVSNAVHLQRASLVSDYDKAIYIAGYLKQGSPKSCFNGLRSSNPGLLHNFAGLLTDFR